MSESLDDFFTITISATTDTQTRAGFGTALFAVQRVPWVSGAVVRAFASLLELTTAGFLPTDPGYHMAAAAFAQNPRPASVKIGPRTPVTHVVRLTPATPVSASDAETYAVTVDGTVCTFTTDATPTVAEACTGLAAAINARCGADADAILATGGASSGGDQTFSGAALNGAVGRAAMSPARRLSVTLSNHADWDATTGTVTGVDDGGSTISETFAIPNGGNATVDLTKHFARVTAIAIPTQSGTGGTFTVGTRAYLTASAASTTHVECTAAEAGRPVAYRDATANLALTDVTAEGGLTADLNALLTADPDFYGLALDSTAADELELAFAWAGSNRRLFAYQSADSACGDPSDETDILSVAQAAAAGYATGWYHPAIGGADAQVAAALLGNRLPVDPGSDTWAFKTLAGVTVRSPTTTARAAVLAKNGNVYERKNGVNVTFPGKVALGEWVDVVRGLDWQRARMQEALFALQTANAKVAYTDEGIRLIAAAIFGVLSQGVTAGLYAADPKPTVSAPRARATSSGNRSARQLPGVTFAAQLAGAIHTATVTGTATA